MSDAGSLTFKQLFKGDRSVVAVGGRIDEHAQFPPLELTGISILIIDFRGVKAINSMGIQAWIAFMKSLPTHLRIGYQHCPLRIVNQMNLFPGFTGGRDVKVLSFYAPYYCATCDRSETVHVDTKGLVRKGGAPALPPRACPACQKPMELGAIEEKYLLFLNRRSA